MSFLTRIYPNQRMSTSSENKPKKQLLMKDARKSEKDQCCGEMKNIMKDWHKAVYHKSVFKITPDMSTAVCETTENKTMCRICQSLDDSVENQQVTPCGCTGSLRYVHMDCLRQWRLTKKAKGAAVSHCELCKQPYNIQLLGETNVPEDNLMKLQEDLKKLVRSGIYLMLLLKSWKEDIINMQQTNQLPINSEQSTTRNPHTNCHAVGQRDSVGLANAVNVEDSTCQVRSEFGEAGRLHQFQDPMNRISHSDRVSSDTSKTTGLLPSQRHQMKESWTKRARNQPSIHATSKQRSSSASSSDSEEDSAAFVTRESLKRRSEKARLRHSEAKKVEKR